MIRNSLGSLLALIGAAAAVWSPFRPWYDGRLGRDFRITQLFEGGGITSAQASLFTGLFLVMLVAAVVTVLGVVFRSRLMVTVAAVLALGFTILWMVRQGQAAGSLTTGDNGLASGVGLALGGGVLLLIAVLVMRGRAGVGRHRKDNRLDETHANQTRHDQSQPDETRPGQRQPDQRQPGESWPGENRPGESQPGEARPDNTRPFPAPPVTRPGDEGEDHRHAA